MAVMNSMKLQPMTSFMQLSKESINTAVNFPQINGENTEAAEAAALALASMPFCKPRSASYAIPVNEFASQRKMHATPIKSAARMKRSHECLLQFKTSEINSKSQAQSTQEMSVNSFQFSETKFQKHSPLLQSSSNEHSHRLKLQERNNSNIPMKSIFLQEKFNGVLDGETLRMYQQIIAQQQESYNYRMYLSRNTGKDTSSNSNHSGSVSLLPTTENKTQQSATQAQKFFQQHFLQYYERMPMNSQSGCNHGAQSNLANSYNYSQFVIGDNKQSAEHGLIASAYDIDGNIIPCTHIPSNGSQNRHQHTLPKTMRRERTRVQLACTVCKVAKAKCDDVRPCKRCIRVGKSHLCKVEPSKWAIRKPPGIKFMTQTTAPQAASQSTVAVSSQYSTVPCSNHVVNSSISIPAGKIHHEPTENEQNVHTEDKDTTSSPVS